MLTIDTNIWAYYLDDQSPFHARVAPQVEAALKTQQIAINTVIVMEVSHFLVKNLGPVEGAEKLAAFLGFPFSVVDFDYRSALDAVEMLKRYSHLGIGGRDATILGMMGRLKMTGIMTHDDALKKVDWLEAVDPAA
ncbi:MAG: type II toxin-antitoxin system VapC family toxin [Nitrososphaerota archaeon]|nr:type II toxin-antitoxin system VapC family toxin [Nitrososphaerota archaeon]